MIYIGIDPGASGGIATIDHGRAEVWKMPETEADIYELMSDLGRFKSFALIEKVGAMPKQGVVSTWKFSGNYHGLRMGLIATGIPFEAVAPGVWQKAMGCLTKGDKNVTKRRAQELFPSIKVTHSIADALLLAEFCRRTRKET